MTAAVAALYEGRVISKVPRPLAEVGFCDCELTSDEFSRLLGEIDSLQLRSLLAPARRNNRTGQSS